MTLARSRCMCQPDTSCSFPLRWSPDTCPLRTQCMTLARSRCMCQLHTSNTSPQLHYLQSTSPLGSHRWQQTAHCRRSTCQLDTQHKQCCRCRGCTSQQRTHCTLSSCPRPQWSTSQARTVHCRLKTRNQQGSTLQQGTQCMTLARSRCMCQLDTSNTWLRRNWSTYQHRSSSSYLI